MREAPRVSLTSAQRAQLEKWCRGGSVPYRLVVRSWIVLLAGTGKTNREIARALHLNPITVARWRSRFTLFGPEGLRHEAPRTGSPRPMPEPTVLRILDQTRGKRPPGASPWSSRALGREVGVSHTAVRRVWRRYGVSPRVARVSRIREVSRMHARRFELEGVYINPPREAIAVSVEESRATPNSGTTRFSADEPNSGASDPWFLDLVGALDAVHRRKVTHATHRFADQEMLSFLRIIEEQTNGKRSAVALRASRPDLSPSVVRWFARRPRFRLVVSGSRETWKRRLLELLRNGAGTGGMGPPPSGLPDLLDAVGRWGQESLARRRSFVWIRP